MKEIWGLHKNPADMVQGVQSFEAIDIQGGTTMNYTQNNNIT